MQIPSSHLSLQKENTEKKKKKILPTTCISFSVLVHAGELHRHKPKTLIKMTLVNR